MDRDISDFVDALMSRFSVNDLQGVLDRLDYPCGFYFGALVLPMVNRQQAAAFLSQTWNDRREAGIVRQSARVVAVGIGRSNHTPVWVEVTHADANGQQLLVHMLRLWVLPRVGGGFGVQMMELIDTASAGQRIAPLAANGN